MNIIHFQIFGRNKTPLTTEFTLPVLMNEHHTKVVGKSRENSFVGFEKNVSDGHSTVTEEAKLPLSI